MSSIRWLSLPELRLTIRLLRKQPVVSITTVLALAVGIGVATTGFTLLDAVLYSRLPFPNSDRHVLVEAYEEPAASRTSLETERFRLLSVRASSFEHLGAFRGTEVNLRLSTGEIVPVRGTLVTADSLRVFPYAPLAGRLLQSADGVRGATPVALLRESLWRRHFSADPAVVGTSATFSGVTRTIVGIMPDAFQFPNDGEIWLPLSDTRSATSFGVLREGRAPAAASAELAALSRQYEEDLPGAPRLRITVVRFTEAISRGLDLLAGTLVGCLVIVLLVIAANVGSLVLARSAGRARELAMRTALGASRGRLVGQIFAEVLILGVIAAAIGLAASQVVLQWVSRTVTDMPFWITFSTSPRTMAFVASVTLLAAAIGGVLPALKATRGDVTGALAAGARVASAGLGPLGRIMLGAQVAVSIAMLNSALIMARGVSAYRNPPVLVPSHEILTARIWSETTSAAAILDAICAIPGVRVAGAATSLPGLSPATRMTEVEATAGVSGVARPAPVVEADARFFEVLGGTAQAGRLFAPADFGADAPPVAIVNEPFVRKFFGGRNPVGARIRTLPSSDGEPTGAWHEIVGIVPDLGLSAGDETMAAGFYVPLKSARLFHIALGTAGDARVLTGPVREAVSRVNPDIQVRDVLPLGDVGREDRAVFAGIGAALGALGGITLLLSVIGTYAILSLAVTRRTREIGIRAALGATRGQVLRAVAGSAALPPAIGALAGIALGQVMASARGIFAFRLPDSSGPLGPPVLAAIMIAAALVAVWVPARRALAIHPAEALRSE